MENDHPGPEGTSLHAQIWEINMFERHTRLITYGHRSIVDLHTRRTQGSYQGPCCATVEESLGFLVNTLYC